MTIQLRVWTAYHHVMSQLLKKQIIYRKLYVVCGSEESGKWFQLHSTDLFHLPPVSMCKVQGLDRQLSACSLKTEQEISYFYNSIVKWLEKESVYGLRCGLWKMILFRRNKPVSTTDVGGVHRGGASIFTSPQSLPHDKQDVTEWVRVMFSVSCSPSESIIKINTNRPVSSFTSLVPIGWLQF